VTPTCSTPLAARVLPLLLLWFGLLGVTVVADWLLHLAHLPMVLGED
jgi:hypothetical protein